MNERAADAGDYGTLERIGGMSVLRYRKRLPHSVEKVWRALVEDDDLAAWFPTTIEGERAPGAPLRFSFREGESEPFAGVMRVFDPPSVMELQWGDDSLRFELHAVEPRATVLDLVVTFPELAKAARDGAGWHVCLEQLDHVVGGTSLPWEPTDRWRAVHPHYVQRLGPEASAIGPPDFDPDQ